MGNNFNLISEAQSVLESSGVADFMTDTPESTGDERLYESGILSVVLIPDFRAARKSIMLDAYHSGDVYHDVRPLGRKSKFVSKKYYKDLIFRMLKSRYNAKHRYPVNEWSIEIGFLQPNDNHYDVDGNEDTTIGKLVGFLLALGYDPLHPLRDPGTINKLQKEFAEVIIDEVNSSRDSGHVNIRRKIDAFAKRTADFVKDYIRGGEKPALSKATISNRKWRSTRKENPITYSGDRGIFEPLSESQQLEAEVLFRVRGEHNWQAEIDRRNRLEKTMEKKADQAATKIVEKKWKEYNPSSVLKTTRISSKEKAIEKMMANISGKVKSKEDLESERRDAEILASRAVDKIERDTQALEYSHGRKIVSTGTETYQQKHRREMIQQHKETKAILLPIAKKFGKIEVWPKELQIKHKKTIEAYYAARRAIEAFSTEVVVKYNNKQRVI